MDRLTRQEIEDERDAAQTLLDESPTAPSFVLDRLRFKIRLCDLALSVLSQEAKPFAIDEHITRLKARIAELEKEYYELIYAVGNKYPHETRHQTALRYIQQSERGGASTTATVDAALKFRA